MTAVFGHIKHIYEDTSLRFFDLKEIIRGLARGDIESCEKFDGQNLIICWDFEKDELLVARNKDNIKQNGLDRYGLSLKFGDRPEIEKIFVEAYDIINESIKPLSYNEKIMIFGSMGNIWHSIEIVNPELPNLIIYDKKAIVFHNNPSIFVLGQPIHSDLSRNIKLLKELIPKIKSDKCEIYPPIKIIPKMDESLIQYYVKQIDDLCSKYKISSSDTLQFYYFKRMMQDMIRFSWIPEESRISVAKSLCGYGRSRTLLSILDPLDKIMKTHVKDMISAEKKALLKIKKPIENIIHNFSSKLLSKIFSSLLEDADKESERILKEYYRCVDIIKNSDDQKGKGILENCEYKIGTGKVVIEGVVFSYRNNTYKVTGSFAPMNRVCAHIKYKNYQKKSNYNDVPLLNGFIAG